MMHFEPLDRPDRQKFEILQIQDGGDLTKFGTVTQFGPRDYLARYRDLKKSKMPAAGILTS